MVLEKEQLYATCWTEFLKEDRTSGQTNHSHHLAAGATPYRINIGTNRYEGYMKHAFILNAKHGTNIAFMGNVSLHEQRADYGIKHYDVNEKNAYASLIFETNIAEVHNLSTGVSLNHDICAKIFHCSILQLFQLIMVTCIR